MIFSENRVPLFRIMLLPKFLRERLAARSTAAHRARRKMRQRESLIGVAWGARPKPGPASPANVSKRGLSARLYVPNQTLILVNARLPKDNLTAGNQGRPGGYGGLEPGSRGISLEGLVGFARRTVIQTHFCDLATHCARALPETSRPLIKRAQGRPGARCTRGPVCGLHKKGCTRAYRAAVNTRPSLRNGFTAYAVLSPETSSWLTPSLSVPLALLRQLDASNGRQDHTVLPYA